MNSINIALLLLVSVSATYRDNTAFWASKLGVKDLTYQAFSGYEQIDWYYPRDTTGMFYQLFGSQGHNPTIPNNRVPLMIWLQGGPGASSQFGAFTQIGPIRIVNGQAKPAPNPWNIMGHLLFLDQPLNVGFSYKGGDREGTDQVSSANQAAQHLLNFMDNFYARWPSLKQSPLYITGESAAGHYIPAFARTIIQNTTWQARIGVKLAGICIGDGWTDPINQVNFYDSFLWSTGIVSAKFRKVLTWFQTNSITNIYQGRFQNATNYFDFITNNDTTPQAYMGGISTFNFRNYDPLDQSFASLLEANKLQFGVTVKYIPGNDAIYTAFGIDISRSYAPDVIVALRNIPVLIYNGQEDFVVNTPGVLQYLNSLNWEGIGQWKRTPKKIWKIHGQVKGWTKVSGNLWFGLVNKAGHMVPTDQPEAAFSLIGHFVNQDNDWGA